MPAQPILKTPRLTLRPFVLADAAEVQRLAGAPEVAHTTGNVPHPYLDGIAERWIESHAADFARGISVVYAVIHNHALIGCVSLAVTPSHRRAELGYWLGVEFWNQGYATEAATALIDYGFGPMELNGVVAEHLRRNPGSGRVMEKLGMKHEGTLRQHVVKDGVFEDLEVYGILVDQSWEFLRHSVQSDETLTELGAL